MNAIKFTSVFILQLLQSHLFRIGMKILSLSSVLFVFVHVIKSIPTGREEGLSSVISECIGAKSSLV